ncbi:MAG: hypothetical protein EOO17_00710 [Chloroflexi bacterium]|nr:MAG: hypothetical protein EOO17_00710 [Chloroflexota bacterium]
MMHIGRQTNSDGDNHQNNRRNDTAPYCMNFSHCYYYAISDTPAERNGVCYNGYMTKAARLITQFTPNHYTISLDIDRIGRAFQGTVTMRGSLAVGANAISLHAKDLIIESVLVDGSLATHLLGENDELRITSDTLQSGDHIVVIGYRGTITDAMHGLYPCYYEHAGVQKEILATQFESHHAREVFPCIDEPEAKATFDLTLTTDEDITVLGNMPVDSQESDGNKLITTFQTSPRMSTYLLAFVAGEMHKKSAMTKSGVEVNVWASPAQPSDSLDFALDTATRAIDFYDDYFGVPYPLPKADHVALPDFTVGAMENWGLITYRETALLADPTIASISTKQRVALVICHELAHQWFGNLVTMKWWNDLWLNESFATMMEYIALDALYPEWNSWMDFSSSVPSLPIYGMRCQQPAVKILAHLCSHGSRSQGIQSCTSAKMATPLL